MTETTLKDRIINAIQSQGPMTVSAFMDLCLHDPKQGYYAARPGLGRDFITAPEISQIFGELIGLWAAHEWQQMGAPERITLCEIGPGRGTLMKDALRAAESVPGFAEAINLTLIEPSPVLQNQLKETLGRYSPVFVDGIEAVRTEQPLILIANEWLDCLPARQFQRVGEAWHERVVGVDDSGDLSFGLSAQAEDTTRFPKGTKAERFELQPGLETLATSAAELLRQCQGRMLFIDYGDPVRAPTDSLRAYKDGQQISPLASPGASDLTIDVDFGRLRRLALARQIQVAGPVPQGGFLMSLGAETRLNQLARAHPDEANALYEGVRKLVDPEEMGMRFNAICLSSEGLPPPAGF